MTSNQVHVSHLLYSMLRRNILVKGFYTSFFLEPDQEEKDEKNQFFVTYEFKLDKIKSVEP